jgi:hypothetical protein
MTIRRIKIIVNIFSALYVVGCLNSCANETPTKYFYSETKRGDLWRIPLIEPYEIVSPTNQDWNLIIKNAHLISKDYFNPGEEYGFQLSNIDSLAIEDSVIIVKSRVAYWPKLSGDYRTTLMIDTKTNEQLIFSNTHHQKELDFKIQELKIKNIRFYDFAEVVIQFQSRQKLPEGWQH